MKLDGIFSLVQGMLKGRIFGGVSKKSAINALTQLKQVAEENIGQVQRELEQFKGKTAQEMAELTSQKDSFEIQLKEVKEALAKSTEALAKKEEELKVAKEYAAKYEQITTKAKHKGEIGDISLEKAVINLEDLAENFEAAVDSMAEFLYTGKGEEAALRQIERQNIEGALPRTVLDAKEYNDTFSRISKEGKNNFIAEPGYRGLLFMMSDALRRSCRFEELKIPEVRKQVKTNAMNIILPYSVERSEDDIEELFERELRAGEVIKEVLDKLSKRFPGQKIKIVPSTFLSQTKYVIFNAEGDKTIYLHCDVEKW